MRLLRRRGKLHRRINLPLISVERTDGAGGRRGEEPKAVWTGWAPVGVASGANDSYTASSHPNVMHAEKNPEL